MTRYVFASSFAMAVASAWCARSPTTTKAAAYGAELQACVAGSATKAESASCRCAVSTRYGRPCDDAGALARVEKTTDALAAKADELCAKTGCDAGAK